ncbi:MAG: hypothetical protein KDA79_22655, partial [Planctomycetaceae bacterium]|nr:hypothetical protein [Planctomycetaceae bacterium]
VISIAPTGTLVPANHLKFYITFSEPMQRPGIFGWFRLKNLTTGEDVPRPFRHTELWSADQKQLTLWFHPGRQKTGVNLNVEIGPVLNEGHRYELVISEKWPSERGTALGRNVTKQITAGPADHQQPDLARWKIVPPAAGTRQPLVVQFDEPLDAALIRSQLRLSRPDGRPVAGTARSRHHERQWEFVPRHKWRAGTCRLEAGNVLEDVAGNSLERPFEVDVSEEAAAEEVPPVLYRSFEILPVSAAAP